MGRHHGAVELLARGVCVCDGALLVCHTAGAAITYLPGGHVEFGESVPDGLVRELVEEIGHGGKPGAFLGVVEHTFVQAGERHFEVNLLFEVSIPELHPCRPVPSRESHLDFQWLPLQELDVSNLEPAPVRDLIRRWYTGGHGAAWASTVAASGPPPG